jgi:hypothetical protein
MEVMALHVSRASDAAGERLVFSGTAVNRY